MVGYLVNKTLVMLARRLPNGSPVEREREREREREGEGDEVSSAAAEQCSEQCATRR